MLPFNVVINPEVVEPREEIWFGFDAVLISRELEHANLRHQLKLLAAFVKVYQTVFRRDLQCRVDHR